MEDFDFFNRTFNIYEYYYNLALCDILKGNLSESLSYLSTISETIQDDEIKSALTRLILIVEQELNQSLLTENQTIENKSDSN